MTRKKYFTFFALLIAANALYAVLIFPTEYKFNEFTVMPMLVLLAGIVLAVLGGFVLWKRAQETLLHIAAGVCTAAAVAGCIWDWIGDTPVTETRICALILSLCLCGLYFAGLALPREGSKEVAKKELTLFAVTLAIMAFVGRFIGYYYYGISRAVFINFVFSETYVLLPITLMGLLGVLLITFSFGKLYCDIAVGVSGLLSILFTVLCESFGCEQLVYAFVLKLILLTGATGMYYFLRFAKVRERAPSKAKQTTDKYKRLNDLHALYIEGVLTEEEYNAEKAKIWEGK